MKKFLVPLIIIHMIFGPFFPMVVYAASTITAASCSNTDVNAAINSTGGTPAGPAIDGDTVIIPAGTCDWTDVVTITNLSISLKGVGAGTEAQCGAAGSQFTYTCIQRPNASVGGLAALIAWTTKAAGNTPAGFAELTGLTIITPESSVATNCSVNGAAAVNIYGHSQNLRIHHNVFAHYQKNTSPPEAGCGAVSILEDVTGVVDHNTFNSHSTNAHALDFGHRRWQTTVGSYGDNSWAQPDTIGTVQALFAEDNTFNTVGVTSTAYSDHGYGARFVWRFNTHGNGSMQSHGTESGGRGWRGPRHAEVYRNKHVLDGSTALGSIESMRGVGTFRVFDNIVTAIKVPNNVVDFNAYRVPPGEGTSGFYPWAYCVKQTATITRVGTVVTVTTPGVHGVTAGSSTNKRAYMDITGAGFPFDGTALQVWGLNSTQYSYSIADPGASAPTSSTGFSQASYDGNTDSTGYPCLDQVGSGQGDLLSGDPFTTQTPVRPLNQVRRPAYIWNNTANGVLDDGQPNVGASVILEERDFYNQRSPFTGAQGIGFGLRSARPGTCTAGTAYWATDGGGNWNTSTTETISALIPGYVSGQDGGLDYCDRTNHWTDDWYVPLSYPHPLVGVAATVQSKFKGVSGSHKISGKVTMK